MLLDWIETNREVIDQAKQNFKNPNNAFKLYNQAHPDDKLTRPKSRNSRTCVSQVSCKKQGALLFVDSGALALGYTAFRFL